ncbi:hypothetical protein B0T22DRAFT_25128 [Podospora appendiculata]|uniref:Uncharacterized protein n=1 Tax=Podospora appendiculata TaxID=314037 RepID=A0AAE0XG19_9PEZI|nr:hypothetical protein B0T22DRAFT_25128 [Podospora appendiculata]
MPLGDVCDQISWFPGAWMLRNLSEAPGRRRGASRVLLGCFSPRVSPPASGGWVPRINRYGCVPASQLRCLLTLPSISRRARILRLRQCVLRMWCKGDVCLVCACTACVCLRMACLSLGRSTVCCTQSLVGTFLGRWRSAYLGSHLAKKPGLAGVVSEAGRSLSHPPSSGRVRCRASRTRCMASWSHPSRTYQAMPIGLETVVGALRYPLFWHGFQHRGTLTTSDGAFRESCTPKVFSGSSCSGGRVILVR